MSHVKMGSSLIRRRPYLVSFLAGAIASLSLPPAFVTPVMLLLGWPLYQAAKANNWHKFVFHIAAASYGWFLISLYWISHSLLVGKAEFWFLIPFSFFGIPVIISLFWVVFALPAYFITSHPVARLLAMVAMLGFGEWGREFIATGFPWNAPGQLFLGSNASSLMASYFGQTGLNLMAFLLAAIIPLWMVSAGIIRRLVPVIGAVFILFLVGFSAYLGTTIKPPQPKEAVIMLVQPNIAQSDKWDRSLRDSHLAELIELSSVTQDSPADLIIWPESAFAGDYRYHKEAVDALAFHVQSQHIEAGGDGHFITGALRFDEDDLLRNSALYFKSDTQQTIAQNPVIYDKTHLVPFGEYVPFRALPFIDAIAGPLDFHPGKSVYLLDFDKLGKGLVLICYEAIFPALTKRASERPDFLINLTNDGWFGHTAGPYQHLAQTRMTAISYGLPLMRIANTGISAVFDATGKQLVALPLGTKGTITHALPAPLPATFFARNGTIIFWLMAFFLLLASLILDRFLQNRH